MEKLEKLDSIHDKNKGFEKQESYFDEADKKVSVKAKHWKDDSAINLYYASGASKTILRFDRRLYTKKEVEEMASQFNEGLQFLIGQVRERVKRRKQDFTESFEIQTTDD